MATGPGQENVGGLLDNMPRAFRRGATVVSGSWSTLQPVAAVVPAAEAGVTECQHVPG